MAVTELPKISTYANGGYIPDTNKISTKFITDGSLHYYLPSTYYVSTTNVGTVIRTIKFTRTDDDGNTTIVEANVMMDGTIHVDPAAFELMMDMMGFSRADNG